MNSHFRLALGGAFAMAAAIGVGRFVYTPILPEMMSQLHLGPAQGGAIASANYAGYMIGALLAATSWIKGPPKTWMLAGLMVSVASTLAMGWASGQMAFLALRALGGIASAFVLVFASSVVLEPLGRSGNPHLSSLHFAGVGTGIALSALLMNGLMISGTAWPMLWTSAGLLAAVLVVPATILLIRAETQAEQTAQPQTLKISQPKLLAAYGLFGFGYVITATFLIALVRTVPLARAAEPWLWLTVGLTAAPSVAIWTASARRIGYMPAFAVGCVLEALGVAASVLMPSATGVLLASALLGGTYMGVTALGLVAARLSSPDPRRALARMTASFGLGQMLGPILAGYLTERTGTYTLASLLGVAALAIAAVLAVTAGRPDSRTSEVQPA
jgi:predicted MFS family arabinose efflux permease